MDVNRKLRAGFKPGRIPTDFLGQRSPFLLFGGGTGRIEGAGIDYTLPYWIGRFYGVIVE